MSDMKDDDTQDLSNQNLPENLTDADNTIAENSSLDQESQATGLSIDDDWAAALAEQTSSEITAGEQTSEANIESAISTNDQETKAEQQAKPVFQPLFDQSQSDNAEIDMVMDIPVQLSVELGRTRLTIKNILQLGQGSVVELDGLAGEPMDICVNGYLIAQGEVVVVEDKYGIRVTDIITPADRIARLNNKR